LVPSVIASSSWVPSGHTVVFPLWSDAEARRREIRLGNCPVEEVRDAAVGGNFLFCLACGFSCLCKFEILRLLVPRKKY
jgi:hypothetical protein